MSWTRREFLTRAAVLGAAVTTGCTTRLGGVPRPGETPVEQETPQLTVGVLAFQPYTVERNGEPAGPVPDVARAVLEKMGITEIRIVTTQDERELLTGIAAGEYDLVGGIVPPQDAAVLRERGVARVFTPKDYELTGIMNEIVDVVREAHGIPTTPG